MNDAALMRMLNRFADLREKTNAISDAQLLLIARGSQHRAFDVFHRDEEVAVCGTAVVDLGDVGMAEHRQRLMFSFESRLLARAGEFAAKNLHSRLAMNRLFLFGR